MGSAPTSAWFARQIRSIGHADLRNDSEGSKANRNSPTRAGPPSRARRTKSCKSPSERRGSLLPARTARHALGVAGFVEQDIEGGDVRVPLDQGGAAAEGRDRVRVEPPDLRRDA